MILVSSLYDKPSKSKPKLKPLLFRVRPHAMGYLYSRSLKWRTSLTMNDLYDCTFANISVSTDYGGSGRVLFIVVFS